jgi:signal transduction histidine kinase
VTGIRRMVGAALRAPWSVRPWLATGHVLIGLPVSVLPAVAVTALGALTVPLLIVPPLALVALAGLFACVRAASAVQRSRFAAFLDARIAAPPRPSRRGGLMRWVSTRARSASTWRQIGYHLLAPWLSVLASVAVVTFWSVGIALATAFLHGWPRQGLFGWNLRDPLILASLTVVGLVVFFAAPWVARGAAALDLSVARRLLGPSRVESLARRVDTLAESRADVVSAADAERRRIERDLHDGAQQRLTALAMNLGLARAASDDLPAAARETIEQAHDEAKQALVELRDLVRGLHPAVLTDRGLDAALSGIAARAPLPVRLHVDLPRRPSPTIEAVAYFVVSEALTNIAKHARADQAEITVERVGDRLHLEIVDDGRGGAKSDSGTGLRGLTQRVASVDGTLRVDSPPGGPTRVIAELPCES